MGEGGYDDRSGIVICVAGTHLRVNISELNSVGNVHGGKHDWEGNEGGICDVAH